MRCRGDGIGAMVKVIHKWIGEIFDKTNQTIIVNLIVPGPAGREGE